MVRSILCPIDRSPSSLQAFDYAIALARWWDARLTLLEVVAPEAQSASDLRAALHADLDRTLTARRVSDLGVEVVLREGAVVEEILARAASDRTDLVVMGSHGAGGEQRAIGSVAAQVLRLASCPVLTVRRGVKQERSSGPPFLTILCATDFSAPAQRAMACAQQLATQAGGTLITMTVIEGVGRPGESGSSVAEDRDAVASARQDRLAQLAALEPSRLHVEPVVAIGTAATEIVAYGERRAVDIVVMGISGHETADAFVLGSTTHHVIRQGGWPVLSVPARAATSSDV